MWALLLLCPSVFAQNLEDVANDPQWLNLYRYHHQGIDNDSTVINDDWFFHPEGRENPYLELEKAISILKTSPLERCRFPARTLYLQRKGLVPKTIDSCPQFEYFAKKLELNNIWIVFASYYVNNPSSAFGHTLFKIEGRGNEGNDFLEYGANFAAQTTTSNPLGYAILGLTGGFLGNYGLLPYFIKIQEYNDSESRDLWEYKLDLTEDEKVLFLAHLWEMDQAKYRYYYLTENCSYHLLSFLDAIRPELNFKDKLPYFVLPSETLSIVAKEKGLVSEVRKRPSQFNIVQHHYEALPEKIQSYWDDHHEVSGDQIGKGLLPKEKARYLDFLIDYIDLTKRKDLLKESVQGFRGEREVTKLKRNIQTQRSQLPEALPIAPLKTDLKTSPDRIHSPRFLALGHDLREIHFNKKQILRSEFLQYRFSFHEMMDRTEGAPRWSELVMGSFTLRRQEDNDKFYFDQFTFFRTQANQQTILSSRGLSWLVEVGAEDYRPTIHHDLGPYGKAHIGYNWQWKHTLIKFVLPLKAHYGSKDPYFDSLIKVEVGPELSLNQHLFSWWRIQVGVQEVWRNSVENDLSTALKVSSQWDITKKWAFSLKAHHEKDLSSSRASLKYYY